MWHDETNNKQFGFCSSSWICIFTVGNTSKTEIYVDQLLRLLVQSSLAGQTNRSASHAVSIVLQHPLKILWMHGWWADFSSNPPVIRVLIAHITIPDGTANDSKDFLRSRKLQTYSHIAYRWWSMEPNIISWFEQLIPLNDGGRKCKLCAVWCNSNQIEWFSYSCKLRTTFHSHV